MRRSLLVIASLFVLTASAAAQSRPLGPVASHSITGMPVPLWRAPFTARADTVDRQIKPTHWKEGMLVGGIVGALGGAVLGGAFCRMSEDVGKDCTPLTLGLGLTGAVILGISGALIGGQFPKEGAETPD